MKPLRVLIVGGGIGGLTAALALRRAGLDPIVFEQARALEPVGAGIQLSPNATRVLIQLGCGDGLRDVAIAPEALEARSFRDGQRIFSMEMGQRCVDLYGAPYYHVHRADLHALLVSSLGPGALRLSARCKGFVEEGDSVRVEFEDGTSAQGDVLIGADGIHSTVRAAMLGPERPRFAGYVAFRALIPAERIADLALERKGTIWLGPGRHVVHYFVSGGRLLNFVVAVPTRTWRLESWSTEGRREEVIGELDGWHPTVQTLLRAAERFHKWALYDRAPLPRWTRGRVTLLGDAAHPMLIFRAQGAAQAIEDAMALAESLSQHEGAPGAALEEYEQRRKPRASQVQEASRRNERVFHLSSSPLVLLRDTWLRSVTRLLGLGIGGRSAHLLPGIPVAEWQQ